MSPLLVQPIQFRQRLAFGCLCHPQASRTASLNAKIARVFPQSDPYSRPPVGRSYKEGYSASAALKKHRLIQRLYGKKVAGVQPSIARDG
jgi:hypothetical protein